MMMMTDFNAADWVMTSPEFDWGAFWMGAFVASVPVMLYFTYLYLWWVDKNDGTDQGRN